MKGYWQLPLQSEGRKNTAFATPKGLFKFVVMPFDLHEAPATFQQLVDFLLAPYERFTLAYLDNVIILS